MKVAFWATTFQADLQALACHLAGDPRFDVLVAADNPELLLSQPVARLQQAPATWPARWVDRRGAGGPAAWLKKLVDRRSRGARRTLEEFGADVLIVDNHMPTFRIARNLLVAWHGFGWRVDDLAQMRRDIAAHVGDVTQPNRRFIWQAFGAWDRAYRISHSRLAAENVVSLGSAYSDLLQPAALAKCFDGSRSAAPSSFDGRRRTVLLAFTWHHGGPLAHWGDDATLWDQLVSWSRARELNLLIRMHDRHRYASEDISRISRLSTQYPGWVEVKFKNEAPDSLVDIASSDVMVSNYSSVLKHFYHTRRPTIHVDPADSAKGYTYRSLRGGRVQVSTGVPASKVWKLPAGDIGGLRAQSFEELLAALERALREPDCCAPLAEAFIARHIERADGTTSARIAELLLTHWGP